MFKNGYSYNKNSPPFATELLLRAKKRLLLTAEPCGFSQI